MRYEFNTLRQLDRFYPQCQQHKHLDWIAMVCVIQAGPLYDACCKKPSFDIVTI